MRQDMAQTKAAKVMVKDPKPAKARRKMTAMTAIDALRSEQRAGTLSIPDGRCWLVIGYHVWGKAFSIRQAWENAEKPLTFMLFDCPPCGTVDDMGAVCWYPHLYATHEQATQGGTYPDAVSIGYAAKVVRTFKDGVIETPKDEQA